MSSSWIDSIWPIFSAAPRILHSALASLCALASLRTPLGSSEGGPRARVTASVVAPHTSPAPSPANPIALPIRDDGTARSLNFRFCTVTDAGMGVFVAGSAAAGASGIDASADLTWLLSTAAALYGGVKTSTSCETELGCASDVVAAGAMVHVLATAASLVASSSCSSCSSLLRTVPASGAPETGETSGRGITRGVAFTSGRWEAWVEKSSWPPCTAV